MKIENKEQIKNRMIKKAASIWGVAPNEIETSFDPLVSLLISACASEISKISGDMASAENRVTERLLELMTPETLSGATPAHAVAFAQPNSNTVKLFPENLFYSSKRIKDQNANVRVENIFFSPIRKFNLVNVKLKYLVCNNQLLSFDQKTKKNRTLDHKKSLPESTLFLAVEADKKINLKDSNLFFELLDIQNVDLFYYYLQRAEFYFNGNLIKVSNSYGSGGKEKEEKSYMEAIFSEKPNKTINIENGIAKNYKKHFYSIESDVLVGENKGAPKFLADSIDFEQYNELEPLDWIEIRFSNVIPNSILKNVFCTFNAFPVINRKLESVSYQLRDFINIVPVTTPDLFLDIKSVENTSGNVYKLKDIDEKSEKKGVFSLRKDNVGKLDSRKAKEYLLHLTDLLKEESAAFSIFGNDFLRNTISEMNQKISLLEQRVQANHKKTAETNYLSVKPYKKKDTLLVDFWSTNGEEANAIKAGSKLNIYKGSEFKNDENYLVTTSFGGKNELSIDERLYAYRRALLSRNRIITKQDVISLCYDICGNKLEKVEVKKGFNTNFKMNTGLTPSINVILYANSKVNTPDIEWESIRTNLLSIIEEQSIDVFPYYIEIKK